MATDVWEESRGKLSGRSNDMSVYMSPKSQYSLISLMQMPVGIDSMNLRYWLIYYKLVHPWVEVCNLPVVRGVGYGLLAGKEAIAETLSNGSTKSKNCKKVVGDLFKLLEAWVAKRDVLWKHLAESFIDKAKKATSAKIYHSWLVSTIMYDISSLILS